MLKNFFSPKNYSFIAIVIILITVFVSKLASADPKQMEKVRDFYKKHKLDFYGDLIGNGNNFDEDEKKHAKLELLADDARVKAMHQLDSLLKSAKGPMRVEMLIRKATLLADRARTATYFQNNPFKTSKIKDPKVYLDESINVFKIVEREFPNHPQMDVVLFSIAYNLGELRKVDAAFDYYTRLVNKFTDSPLVGDARLARAEYYFDKRKFHDSLKELDAIVKSDHPRLKNFALYKMSWSYYNLSDIDMAISSLEKVIDGVNKQGLGGARLELRKEALHDLVSIYAEKPGQNNPENATEYFNKIAKTPDHILTELQAIREKKLKAYAEKGTPIPEEEDDTYQISEPQELLFRLISVYRDQGKHEQSLIVAGQLLEQLPQHPKTVALYRLRAEGYEKLRRREAVIKELQKLAAVVKKDLDVADGYEKGLPEMGYENLKEYFSHSEPNGSENRLVKTIPTKDALLTNLTDEKKAKLKNHYYLKNLEKTAFETLRDFAKFYHGEWSKTSQKDISISAIKTYDLAIDSFVLPWRGHTTEECFELVNNRAALLFKLNQFEKAADDFRWLSFHYIKEKDRTSAIKGEIAALESLMKEKKIQIGSETKMNPVHALLLSAYDRFLAFHFGKNEFSKESADILAASARMLKDYKVADEALERMRFYTFHFSKEKDNFNLTRDILAIYETNSRWIDLRDYTEKLLDKKVYEKTEVEKDLKHSYEFASLRILEDLEKNKDWKSAVKEFAKFAEKNPNSSFVPQALMKSAGAAIELKDIHLSIDRLTKATEVSDTKTALQAWVALEPYFRKGFHYAKLEEAYKKILSLKPDAKLEASIKANLKSIQELKNEGFMKKTDFFVESDPQLKTWIAIQEKIVPKMKTYFDLRFLKSNNNPANNFKKKAALQADVLNEIEKLASKAPDNFRSSALLWSGALKAQVLYEFAETIKTAAAPAALKGASEADIKAYTETLAKQSAEVFETAKKQIEDTRDLSLKLEEPDNKMLQKINQTLALFGEKQILVRSDFSEIWKKRPKKEVASEKDKAELKEYTKLMLRILDGENDKDILNAKLDLAELYFKDQQFGQSYAVIADILAAKKDEFSVKANAIRFSIDLLRLPEKIVTDLNADNRWNLARWLLVEQKMFEDKDQKKWFEMASESLLKPILGDAPKSVELSKAD